MKQRCHIPGIPAALACVALFALSPKPVSAQALNFSDSPIYSGVGTVSFPAIAMDQNGTIHAVYNNIADTYVYYVKKTAGGSWNPPGTDVGDAADPAHLSIAVGVDGSVHLAFATPTSGLGYARFNGVSWSSGIVDGDFGHYTSIAVDGAGNPHLAYGNSAITALKYAKSCDGGITWSTQTVDSGTELYPSGLPSDYNSRQVSIALDGSGKPRVAYYDDNGGPGNVFYKEFISGTTWTGREQVPGLGSILVGISLALDGSGNPHVSYADNASALYYSSKTVSTAWGDPVQVLTDLANFSTSMALDGSGRPHIFYGDASNSIYGRDNGVSWSTQTIDGTLDPYFASLAIDASGNPHMAYATTGGTEVKYASATAAGFSPPMGGNSAGKVQAPSDFTASAVSSSAITWAWTDNSSNELGFRLYGAPTSTGPFTLIKGTDTIGSNTASYSETGLTQGATYFRYVAAVNAGGVVTSSGSAIVTKSATAQEPPAETVGSFTPGISTTVAFVPPSGEIKIELPASAFKEAVIVTVKSPASVPAPSAGLKKTDLGVEITLNKQLQPDTDVTISVSYQNLNLANFTESRLILARHDTGQNIWVPLISSLDTAAKKITARTGHLSVFQVMQMGEDSLANAKVFPNPFRPAKGHTSVTFANLPPWTRIRLYTIAGELVKDISADSSGMAKWDGANQSGQKAASGVYFALLQGGDDKTTLKVAIQR